MKILILGSGSFAGQLLFSHYIANGDRVIGINRSKPKDSAQWPWVKNIKNFDNIWYQYDLTNSLESIIEVSEKFQPEIIIDFLGEGMVAPSWLKPELWYETNVSKKAKLLNSFLNLNSLKKYIRASTPEVYGSNIEFQNEESSFNPSTPYAVSHSSIDMHLRCLGNQYKFPYVIGRFANFYGVGQQLYRVIPKLFLCCLSKRKFVLDGGGKSSRSFIFSKDIITAFDSMINISDPYKEYNFSSNEEVTISELVNKICNLIEVKRSEIIELGPERPGKDMFYRLDISKSKLILGWEPSIDLNSGLIEVKNWIMNSFENLSKRSWDY